MSHLRRKLALGAKESCSWVTQWKTDRKGNYAFFSKHLNDRRRLLLRYYQTYVPINPTIFFAVEREFHFKRFICFRNTSAAHWLLLFRKNTENHTTINTLSIQMSSIFWFVAINKIGSQKTIAFWNVLYFVFIAHNDSHTLRPDYIKLKSKTRIFANCFVFVENQAQTQLAEDAHYRIILSTQITCLHYEFMGVLPMFTVLIQSNRKLMFT